MFRAPDGQVAQNGTATVEVLVIVPASVRSGSAPGRALAFGHGFFGGKDELESKPARLISDRLGAVLFGIDWRGMSKPDIVAVADTFADAPQRVTDFAERVHQAMASWLVTTALVRTRFVDVPELRRKDGGPLWDPSFIGYFGASQATSSAGRSRPSTTTSAARSSTSAAAASSTSCRAPARSGRSRSSCARRSPTASRASPSRR